MDLALTLQGGILLISLLLTIILSIIAVIKLGRRWPASRYAIALITICILVFLIAQIRTLGDRARDVAREARCARNIQMLIQAIKMYCQENNNSFPLADKWCEGISPHIKDEDILHCYDTSYYSSYPEDSEPQKISYAFNSALSDMKFDSLKEPTKTIVIFESNALWNDSGGSELLPERPRHVGRDIYGFADGHTEVIFRKHRPGPEYWHPK